MRLHFVTVPMFGGEAAEAALNAFVAGHRVLAEPSRGSTFLQG